MGQSEMLRSDNYADPLTIQKASKVFSIKDETILEYAACEDFQEKQNRRR